MLLRCSVLRCDRYSVKIPPRHGFNINLTTACLNIPLPSLKCYSYFTFLDQFLFIGSWTNSIFGDHNAEANSNICLFWNLCQTMAFQLNGRMVLILFFRDIGQTVVDSFIMPLIMVIFLLTNEEVLSISFLKKIRILLLWKTGVLYHSSTQTISWFLNVLLLE